MKEYCSCREPDIMCAHCEREEKHQGAMERRSLEIASRLIRQGKDPKWAYKYANRKAAIEFNESLEWRVKQ